MLHIQIHWSFYYYALVWKRENVEPKSNSGPGEGISGDL